VRLSAELIKEIDVWGNKQQKPAQSRSEAIRRLVEAGLARAKAARAGRTKSADMAGQTIDRLTDPAATPEEKDQRKRRLLKGPTEFRDMRGDAPKSSTRKS
jgi:hypothetical protein